LIALILLLPRFISEYGYLLAGKVHPLFHVNSNINFTSKFDLDFDVPIWNTS